MVFMHAQDMEVLTLQGLMHTTQGLLRQVPFLGSHGIFARLLLYCCSGLSWCHKSVTDGFLCISWFS